MLIRYLNFPKIKLINYICSGLCVVAFAFSFFNALQLKMQSEVSYWVWHAVSPAFSKVALDAPRYMTSNVVYEKFMNGSIVATSYSINGSLEEFSKSKNSLNNSFRIFPSADDKGIVIFTEIAFRLFGLKIEGVLYLYYLVLGFSGIIFAYAYRNSPFALMALAGFYIAHCLMLPMIKYNVQFGGITALRCFPILSMVALLHCILFFFQRKVSYLDLLMASIQMGLIVFIIFIRSTAIWEWYIVVIMSLFCIFRGIGPNLENLNPAKPSKRISVLYMLCVTVFLLGVLKTYINFGLPSEYYAKDQIATRVFWHNIYSGLVFNPKLAAQEDIHIDDYSIVERSKRFLLQNHREKEWQEIIGSSKNGLPEDWNKYDVVVKEALIDLCKNNTSQCALTFLWYKPLSLLKNILWVYGVKQNPPNMDAFVSSHPGIGTVVQEQFLQATQLLDDRYDRGLFLFFKIAGVSLIFLLIARNYADARQIYSVVGSVGILMLGSTIPSIIGYPAPHTIGEVALASTLFIFCFFLVVGLWLSRQSKKLLPP